MINAFDVDDKRSSFAAGAWVVMTKNFNEATVATDVLFGHNETIGRLVLGSETLEANA
jgi:hypothetical protein